METGGTATVGVSSVLLVLLSFGTGWLSGARAGVFDELTRKLSTTSWMLPDIESDTLLVNEEIAEETEAREAAAKAPALDKESPPVSDLGETGEGVSLIKEADSGVPLLEKVLLTASETARKPSVTLSTKEADMKTRLFPGDESEVAA